MKKLMNLFCITCFAVALGQNGKGSATKVSTIAIAADQFMGYDPFGFYYTAANHVFSKTNGTDSFEYKNVSLGSITKADVLNPLKIVLLYENFNTVVLLDNQLNEIQKINFSENSVPIVATAVGIAAQNQLWIYNTLQQQIGLYDYLTNDYKAVSTSFPDRITYYQSDFNSFSWIDEKHNWYSCDLFGKITNKGKIADFDAIALISDQQYIVSRGGTLIMEAVGKGPQFEIEILEKTFKKFCYKDQILSIFTSEGITNYKIIIP